MQVTNVMYTLGRILLKHRPKPGNKKLLGKMFTICEIECGRGSTDSVAGSLSWFEFKTGLAPSLLMDGWKFPCRWLILVPDRRRRALTEAIAEHSDPLEVLLYFSRDLQRPLRVYCSSFSQCMPFSLKIVIDSNSYFADFPRAGVESHFTCLKEFCWKMCLSWSILLLEK